jgi:hypothetical protein
MDGASLYAFKEMKWVINFLLDKKMMCLKMDPQIQNSNYYECNNQRHWIHCLLARHPDPLEIKRSEVCLSFQFGSGILCSQ